MTLKNLLNSNFFSQNIVSYDQAENYLMIYKIRHRYLKLCGVSLSPQAITGKWLEAVIERRRYNQPIRENYVIEEKWRRLKGILNHDDIVFLDYLFEENSQENLNLHFKNFINRFSEHQRNRCKQHLDDAVLALKKWKIRAPKETSYMGSC